MWSWFERHHWRAALVGLAAVTVVGVLLHRDYGVPWDEPTQRGYAQVVGRYALHGDPRLFSDVNRVYGPAHELVLLAAENVFGAREMRDVFAIRHLCNFLVFVLGLIFLYRLGLAGLRSGTASLLVCLALVLSPLIFGAAFYNSKDLPFLSFFIVAAYTLLRFTEHPTVRRASVHALASAWLIAIRMPGILLPALTAAGAIWYASRAPEHRRRVLLLFAWYISLTAFGTWAFWPTLWRHPIGEFALALRTMSRYPWPSDVLYRGRLVPATALPWHYAVVWIAITTPIMYVIGLIVGIPAMAARALSELRRSPPADGFFPILVLAWLFVPLSSVAVLHSVLYDGWRHLFFVYPALLLISMQGFMTAGRSRRIAAVAAIAALVNMADVARVMVQTHPHEHVFFNSLVGGVPGARFRYEMDYWGLSYRRGLEEIAARDRGALITILGGDPAAPANAGALPYRDRSRLLFVDSPEQAKYFIGTYRLRQQEYDYGPALYQVRVSGAPILTVNALHPDLSLGPIDAPPVRAAATRNAALAATDDDGALRARVETGIRTWLARFARNAGLVQVQFSTSGTTALRQGRVDTIHVVAQNVEVGDFRRRGVAIPLDRLDATLHDVVLDFSKGASAETPPIYLQRATLAELVLDADAINRTLERRTDSLREARLQFEDGALGISWSGRPRIDAIFRLRSGPDPWKAESDNLWLDVTRVRLAGLRLPVARFLQVLLARVSPVVGPDALQARLTLGAVKIDGARLHMGTRVANR
jgi:DUF2993 family protein